VCHTHTHAHTHTHTHTQAKDGYVSGGKDGIVMLWDKEMKPIRSISLASLTKRNVKEKPEVCVYVCVCVCVCVCVYVERRERAVV